MESKTTPWMISTFVLVGVVVGFGVAQFSGGFSFGKPPDSSVGIFKAYAKELGLKKKQFNQCLDSGKFATKVKEDLSDGTRFGISGTPGFFVNGRSIDGAQPYEVFEKMFTSLLEPKDETAASADSEEATDTKTSTTTNKEEKTLTDEDYKKIADAVSAKGISEGDANAPVIMVEFGDFQCPFCSRFWEQTLPKIRENYIKTGKVRMIYRHFPLDFHPHAQKAAEASECANEQGKFWEMHDKIFQGQKIWSVLTKVTEEKK